MKYNPGKKEIICNKELNNLDKFALDFLQIVGKHVDYVVVAGYVSILLGRTRITEDIDVFIKKISKEKFIELYKELLEKDFWCLNAENIDEIYGFLEDKLAVRFAYKNTSIPNFEVKFPKDKLDEEVFEDCIIVKLSSGKIKISSLERHIAFKKYFLGSDKDVEDALHIEATFKEEIDDRKIKKLEELIKKRQNGKTIS